MNCCDDYGNCTQGRDCPIRRQRYEGLTNRQVYRRIALALLIFWVVVLHLVLYMTA